MFHFLTASTNPTFLQKVLFCDGSRFLDMFSHVDYHHPIVNIAIKINLQY